MAKATEVIALHSGGLDSSTLLCWLLDQGYFPRSLGVLYGQTNWREVEKANVFCARIGVPRQVVDLKNLGLIMTGCSLTDSSVEMPEGHYSDQSMRATVVPNRNMILLACAAAYAVSLKVSAIAYAPHVEDHGTYPDCRPSFAEAMRGALALSDYEPVELLAPFIYWSKPQIVMFGEGSKIHWEDTWTCYRSGEKHCGVCGACSERHEAFRLAGVVDPTEYEGQNGED